MEYCYHVTMLDKHRVMCKIVGSTLAAFLKPLAQGQNVASLNLFYKYYFGRRSSWVRSLVIGNLHSETKGSWLKLGY